ncbi:MAG: phosphatase PAP2 family protein [Solobacterium sp.]|nr:phosphatase PAP2 family protein [Solobacterium sp.]
MNKNYPVFYKQLTEPYREDGIEHMLNTFNELITFLFYALYPLLLIYMYLNSRSYLLKSILVPGISFLLISLFRVFFDRPRPYETFDIDPLIKKSSSGHSMPSRHIFSCMVIAMTVLQINESIGVLLLLAGLCEAYIRVLGGVHYLDDVVAGAVLGVLAGLIYFI